MGGGRDITLPRLFSLLEDPGMEGERKRDGDRDREIDLSGINVALSMQMS